MRDSFRGYRRWTSIQLMLLRFSREIRMLNVRFLSASNASIRWIAILFVVVQTLFLSAYASAETKSVRVKTANFREAPSDGADVLFTADRYYPVRILARKSGWAKVKDFEGEVAWIAERLLGPQKGIVVIVEKTVARDGPQADASAVFDAKWSESFAVKQIREGWVLVESAQGLSGWLSQDVVWGIEP
ncbi:MAG TPA: SH3 domain-containing protein [Polyangiaceae bacterium]|nr:SH3 domain-containing protein [Polyangiaceae bacterium]HNZ21788.1 SH3 domain-containing protein [Polyangiaceae bacterium]HOD23488.1 SH3 domain-containing protein [Polyangiaceae bacterium]HOE51507.1 SH3 domain-containing protein [Polyangiaceae bacterium]HOG99651.1 SH3 domain-containing protein [Polyangiaceae bacterium]